MTEHQTPLPPSLAEPALVELALLQSHGAVNAPAIAAALQRLKELEQLDDSRLKPWHYQHHCVK